MLIRHAIETEMQKDWVTGFLIGKRLGYTESPFLPAGVGMTNIAREERSVFHPLRMRKVNRNRPTGRQWGCRSIVGIQFRPAQRIKAGYRSSQGHSRHRGGH